MPKEIQTLRDALTYHEWSSAFWQHGALPGRDYAWEYPPGAFPFIALPFYVRSAYLYATLFAAQMLLVDALLLATLARRARRTGEPAGVVLWLAAIPLLGPMVFARFDLVPAALTVLALFLLGIRPRIAGGLLAAATLVKLWPAVALAALASGSRGRRPLLLGFGALLGGAAVIAVMAGVAGAFTTTLATQQERGVQVESLAALPYLWAGAFTAPAHVVFQQQSMTLSVSSAAVVASATAAAATVAVLLILLRRLRNPRASIDIAALVTALVATVVLGDKVFSTQYVVWILAPMALSLCERGRHQRALLLAGLATAMLTHIVYPLTYRALLSGSIAPLIVLTCRDATLAVSAWLLVRRAFATHPLRDSGSTITADTRPAVPAG